MKNWKSWKKDVEFCRGEEGGREDLKKQIWKKRNINNINFLVWSIAEIGSIEDKR